MGSIVIASLLRVSDATEEDEEMNVKKDKKVN